MKMMQKNEFVPEEVELDEDGHTDVSSAVRKCMTITEDAQDISSKLRTMSPEDSLPSWWTNKLAVASNSMNKMRDYIVNPLGEALDKKDEPTVKRIVGKLKKASQAHAGQAKDLEKAMDEDAVETAKDKIAKEKETDKKKHDKMMDRARIQQARQTNMATEEVEIDEAIAMTDEDLTNMYHATIKMMKRGMSQKQALNKQAKDVGATRKETAKVKQMLDKAGFKEEVDLDEKVISLAKGMGKEVVNDGGEIKLMKGGKVISSGDYDRGAGVFFMNVKGKKGQVSFKQPKDILGIKEEVEVDEQLAKIKGKTPADDGRRAAVEDDIERAKKKGDKKLVKKLKERILLDKINAKVQERKNG